MRTRQCVRCAATDSSIFIAKLIATLFVIFVWFSSVQLSLMRLFETFNDHYECTLLNWNKYWKQVSSESHVHTQAFCTQTHTCTRMPIRKPIRVVFILIEATTIATAATEKGTNKKREQKGRMNGNIYRRLNACAQTTRNGSDTLYVQ